MADERRAESSVSLASVWPLCLCVCGRRHRHLFIVDGCGRRVEGKRFRTPTATSVLLEIYFKLKRFLLAHPPPLSSSLVAQPFAALCLCWLCALVFDFGKFESSHFFFDWWSSRKFVFDAGCMPCRCVAGLCFATTNVSRIIAACLFENVATNGEWRGG